ncbi:xylose isomerase [Mesorhizobium sp. Root157]|uniref:sugar phosphate isomerase/epimerase family protein n=1 Tax=Mesorhizobium sp. Root157 TaxID=1736477 RepID=UPI000700BC97|nr:sugar phosphate isomerase/epimerase [Mesorhizobium sp. Root157]KQZ80924.1 xylose isomerase [Mesorhizobium sp. Root157]
MAWSFQLYSARNFQPWDKVLDLLGGLGYREVEGYGGVYDEPSSFRSALDRNGLAMPSGHFGIEALEGDFDGVRAIADTLGIRLLICPYLEAGQRPTDATGWHAFGERLAKVGETAKRHGYDFAWHNHEFEFTPLADGSAPMQHILAAAPGMGWEMDVAWVARGGIDPLPWIARHGARIVAVHVKDMAGPGKGLDEDGWADVGHGTLGWPSLFAALRSGTKARHYVMEQDNPNDIGRFARRSIEAAKAWREA